MTIILQLQNTLTSNRLVVEKLLQPVLKTLDPALFQNIILGILAIFIPFAIVFLTDIISSKGGRSEFEKMVLNDEVLGTVKVFLLSVIGIAALAFFSGKDISVERKLLAIIISAVVVWLLWKPFSKMMRFAEGYKPEFELNFLRRLNLSRLFSFRNKLKMDRLRRAWESFWVKPSSPYTERDFTQVFMQHVDSTIKIGRFDFAAVLAQIYAKSIDKREKFSVSYYILPKIFEWHEKAWDEQQAWLGRQNFKEKNIAAKYPFFVKKLIYILEKLIYKKDDFYWNWHYFQQDFFPVVAKVLLNDGYQFFASFKKHINEAETRLDGIEDEKEKEKFWQYILGWFTSFCKMFFESIDGLPSGYDIWEHYFPQEWKIIAGNADKRIPRVFLQEFLKWTQSRIFKKNEQDWDSKLSEVAGGLFPGVHGELFPAFLVLFFSTPEIKSAIKREPSFSLIGTSMISYSGEKTDEEIQQMMEQQSQSQKEETIEVILKYFHFWRYLQLYKEDMSEEESAQWKDYNESQRKIIVNRVRKTKLQGLLDELNSDEVVTMCKESERFEDQRKTFIEIVKLLLNKI